MVCPTTSVRRLAGVSKFVAGVMGAQFSARLMLGLGLMATATVNIAFGFSSSLTAFCLLWGLNGMLQGVGAPTCATILTRWFASKERGTYWGMWNIAHNLGGFLAPVIVGEEGGRLGKGGWLLGRREALPCMQCRHSGLLSEQQQRADWMAWDAAK